MSATGDVFFERVLLPHRSLPPAAFHVLMLLLGLVSLVMGIGFFLLGAWPICGFFGLDVAAVYVAFRLSYRSARQREILRLAGGRFHGRAGRHLRRAAAVAVPAVLAAGGARGAARRVRTASSWRRMAEAW